MKLGLVLLYLLYSSCCLAERYRFASIHGLAEQEVGRIVLPQIYATLNHTLIVSPVPAKRAQSYAAKGYQQGEVMRIFQYGEQNDTLLRVPTPYYYLESMAFVRKSSEIKIRDIEDFKGLAIAKVRGVLHTELLTLNIANVHNVDSTREMMKLLNAGMVDVALTSNFDGQIMLKKMDLDTITWMPEPLAKFELYHYIHVNQRDLVSVVDRQIRKMRDSGELARLITEAEQLVMRQ